MQRHERKEQQWALVIAPKDNGWTMRCLPEGAYLATGGYRPQDLDAVLDDVRILADLLVHDQLTASLLVSSGAEAKSTEGMIGVAAS